MIILLKSIGLAAVAMMFIIFLGVGSAWISSFFPLWAVLGISLLTIFSMFAWFFYSKLSE